MIDHSQEIALTVEDQDICLKIVQNQGKIEEIQNPRDVQQARDEDIQARIVLLPNLHQKISNLSF
jgi:hypothetical protein